MNYRTLVILLSAAMLTTVSAEVPSTVFDMSASGDAQMTITETVPLDVNDINLGGSFEAGSTLTFTGTVTDSLSELDPDYSMRLTSEGSGATASMESKGPSVADLLALLGAIDMEADAVNSNGELELDATVTMSRLAFEYILNINSTQMQQDPQAFRLDIESTLNEMFSLLPIASKPQVSISQFSVSGGETLTVVLKMSVQGWNDLMATLASLDAQGTDSDLMSCMGLSSDAMTSAMLSAGMTATISLSASGDTISTNLDISGSGGFGNQILQSSDMQMQKTGAVTTMSGSVSFTDAQTFISCVMKDYLPGEYLIENLRYSLVTSADSEAVQTIEGAMTGLGQKSGGTYKVSFPAEVTAGINITVNAPSSMSISSVSGGEKTGDRSATSSPGEDFTVTYGPKGGLDMNLIIIAVVVVLVLFLLLRKKPSEARPKRR